MFGFLNKDTIDPKKLKWPRTPSKSSHTSVESLLHYCQKKLLALPRKGPAPLWGILPAPRMQISCPTHQALSSEDGGGGGRSVPSILFRLFRCNVVILSKGRRGTSLFCRYPYTSVMRYTLPLMASESWTLLHTRSRREPPKADSTATTRSSRAVHKRIRHATLPACLIIQCSSSR